MLAYRLGCSIISIEQMRTTEFMEWLAFFELERDKQISINKQHNGKFR
jgi:hypothetical protein